MSHALSFIPDKKLNILLLGSGGREHALADKIRTSEFCGELHCAPGNAGIAEIATCHNVKAEDVPAVVALAQKLEIDFVMVGPETPLVAGVVDALAEKNILAFGPTAAAAQLEGSKAFMKEVAVQAGVPTAEHKVFTNPGEAKAYVFERGTPIVIKTDGLAAGKGVVVAIDDEDAYRAIDAAMIDKVFEESGRTLIIEDYLDGPEISLFAICDGERAICVGAAQDHKRVGEGDLGPNTGGMGTYAPVPLASERFKQTVMEQFIFPTLAEMQKRGAPYRGILFAGLMVTKSGIRLIEYNARWGDPETQVIAPRIEGDLLLLFWLAAQGRLDAAPEVSLSQQSALCVVMAANGYPGAYEKGSVIKIADQQTSRPADQKVKIYHAGTARNDKGELTAYGGRVLNIVGFGDNLRAAQQNAYAAIANIHWPEGFYRRDIGWRELS